MNYSTSGATNTTMTTLDGHDDSSIGGYSSATNTSSRLSLSMKSITLSVDSESSEIRIYNYAVGNFENYTHSKQAKCEDICIEYCRKLGISPTTRLLFGLRVYDTENAWVMPGDYLLPKTAYCFRMRFKVPSHETRLQELDVMAYEYLYRQLRHDMVHEKIPEIRYPNKKDEVLGLGVVDMYIDEIEKTETDVERIISNYKRYLPRRLIKAHRICLKTQINKSYGSLRSKAVSLHTLKNSYIVQISQLAKNYLMERYVAIVNYLPGDDQSANNHENGNVGAAANDIGIHVHVKLDLNDTAEPGLKVARMAAEENLKWTLVENLSKIYSLCAEGEIGERDVKKGEVNVALLEISGFTKAYRMQFDSEIALKSFTSYLAGYIRLTSKWMLDLCGQYPTPSLIELKSFRIHGPVGGNFAYAKIRERRDECGRYLIRQCEREYDIYYIDMNTRNAGLQVKSCKAETFKIKREINKKENEIRYRWILYLNNQLIVFDWLKDLAKAIPADTDVRLPVPPSEYDKPPLLLMCLPKKHQSLEIEHELNDSQLQRKRVQIFDPKIDLQWYKDTATLCNGGKMWRLRADWIQKHGSYKDVSVTLKALKFKNDFKDFMKLTNTWSKIYSPQFIKLYGITLSTPHTMIMEYAPFGPLNEFLRHLGQHATIRLLVEIVQNLVRGMVYLHELNMVHGRIRCANLYVTKFDPIKNFIISKISDPGLPRSYTEEEDLPWIPFEYYSNINAAHDDRYADNWAFGTTVWEIFARGKRLRNLTVYDLRNQYSISGGILPQPSDCPDEAYFTMMDGWNIEPVSRFNLTEIFKRLNDLNQPVVISPPNSDQTKVDLVQMLLEKQTTNQQIHEDDEEFNGFHDEDDEIVSSFIENNDNAAIHRKNVSNFFDSTKFVIEKKLFKLICKEIIGQGHYGKVYEGEMQYKDGRNISREKVAVKMLKNSRNKQFNKDFEREFKIMQQLNHPNIVEIKQWMVDPICIVMEYLECGSFLVYLNTKPDLTNDHLLLFAFDIAKGMEYLRSKNIVHRDLAARNILVDGNHVKISDFGLAQMCGSKGYYEIQSHNRPIPYKWYSPDALKTEKYSFYSDVWSYGVTLFEMFSRGDEPNLEKKKEISQIDFLNRLERGERLPKPDDCPNIVYERLMLRCWDKVAQNRPTFTQLVDEIKSILKPTNGEIN